MDKKNKRSLVAKKPLRTAGALTAEKAPTDTPAMVKRAADRAGNVKFNGKRIGALLNREVIELMARAVIESMRNPTEEAIQWAGMAEIGSVWETTFPGKRKKEPVTFPLCIALMDTGCREPGKAILDAWREMVDASLETKPYHRPAKSGA